MLLALCLCVACAYVCVRLTPFIVVFSAQFGSEVCILSAATYYHIECVAGGGPSVRTLLRYNFGIATTLSSSTSMQLCLTVHNVLFITSLNNA